MHGPLNFHNTFSANQLISRWPLPGRDSPAGQGAEQRKISCPWLGIIIQMYIKHFSGGILLLLVVCLYVTLRVTPLDSDSDSE